MQKQEKKKKLPVPNTLNTNSHQRRVKFLMAAAKPLITNEINKSAGPNNLIDMYLRLDIAYQSQIISKSLGH